MMKSKNILVQEEEFRKLNAEIDSKTEDLMTQVEQIKEFQLRNEKLYSDWSATDPNTQIELIEAENKTETLFQVGTEEKLSEDNIIVNEYLSRRKDESSRDISKVGGRVKDDDLKKVNARRTLKLSQSAKITPSLIGPQDEEFSLGITRHKSDAKLPQGKLENDVIPETLKGVGTDGTIRFLTAKVKLLSDQLDIVQKDEKKHVEKIKELQAQNDKLVEERGKLLQQANVSKNILVKYEKHVSNMSAQLQSTQTENSKLKKEIEILKRDMRQSNKNYSANEIRLNRTLEEVEKLKSTVQQMKQEEKEFKEFHRKKTEDLSGTIKTLDRQRVELVTGFKKQMLIIDNLKRQRGLIEAGKLLKSAEDDFINFLDCNPPNTASYTESGKSTKS